MPSRNRNPNPSRRRFLHAGALMSAGLVLIPGCGSGDNTAGETSDSDAGPAQPTPEPFIRSGLGTVIGPGRGKDSETGEMAYFVGLLDLDNEDPQVKVIDDMHFFGHGVSPNPVKPQTAVIFEKHGKGSCEVNLEKGRVLRKIETVHGREFYGHGAFTPDGKTLFATEAVTADNSYDGVVAIRDGDSFDIKGIFPTYGVAPHDCILVDDGATLVITNGGTPVGTETGLPNVTYVDVKTHELKHELTFPTKDINAGHLSITSKGDLVVVSAPREGLDEMDPGSITFYSPGGKVRTIVDDPIRTKMKSETLSVAIHEPSMVVGATNPKGHLITFWDFKAGKLLHHIEGEFQDPRGISCTLDSRYFVVTYDESARLILIDADTLEPVEESKIDASYMSGSHNITYDL